MCLHVQGSVDAGANWRIKHVAGHGDCELDHHLGREYRAGRDVNSAAEGVNNAGPCRCVEHGARRGWCVGSRRLMRFPNEGVGAIAGLPVMGRAWLLDRIRRMGRTVVMKGCERA